MTIPSPSEREALKKAWAEKHNVKPSKASGRSSRSWWLLAGWKKPKTEHEFDLYTPPPGLDHTSVWTRDRKIVCITSEPYQLYGEDLRRQVAFAQALKLHLMITTDSWYYHGSTLMVEFWNEKAIEAERRLQGSMPKPPNPILRSPGFPF